MARTAGDDDDDGPPPAYAAQRGPRRDPRLKDLGISCMLNTEVGALLAVIRRRPDPYSYLPPAVAAAEEATFAALINSLKALRGLLFQPRHGAWRCSDPSTYLTPFLDVMQSEEASPAATGVALSSVLKILRIDVFDECSPGARDAVHAILTALTNCRIERISDAGAEEAVLLRVLQVPPCSSPASGAAVDLQAVAPAASPPTSPMSCQPPPSTPSLAMAGARARKG